MMDRESSVKFFQDFLTSICKDFPEFRTYMKNPQLAENAYDSSYYEYFPEEETEEFSCFREKHFAKELFKQIDDYVYSQYRGIVAHGAFRRVFVLPNCPYVLKFSYSSYIGEGYYEMDDCCEIEECLYEEAEVEGLSQFFGETFALPLYIDGEFVKGFYLMKRYDCDEYLAFTDEELDRNVFLSDTVAGYEEFSYLFEDECLALKFYDSYSDEELEALEDFLKQRQMCDFHSGNIGFDEEGRPVIIDYAFFRY